MNELVQRLSEGEHPVEASLRPEKTATALKESIAEDMCISNSQTPRVVLIWVLKSIQKHLILMKLTVSIKRGKFIWLVT